MERERRLRSGEGGERWDLGDGCVVGAAPRTCSVFCLRVAVLLWGKRGLAACPPMI